MIERENLFPGTLSKRIVGGHLLLFFKHVDVRMEHFGTALPTSTTVEVRRLSHPDFLVEIEAIAVTRAS